MLENYTNELLGLTIKSTKRLFSCLKNFIDMMGYKIYEDHIAIRKRNFKKMRRKWIKFKNRKLDLHTARSISQTYGFVKHTNSFKITVKYKLKALIERAKEVVSQHDKQRKRFYRETTEVPIL